MSKRRIFSREFKLAAVKKVVEKDRSLTEVARYLSVSSVFNNNWLDDYSPVEVAQHPFRPTGLQQQPWFDDSGSNLQVSLVCHVEKTWVSHHVELAEVYRRVYA